MYTRYKKGTFPFSETILTFPLKGDGPLWGELSDFFAKRGLILYGGHRMNQICLLYTSDAADEL